MYGCGPAVVCAVKMIFVTTILAPLSGFHQNAHVAAGQPWKIVLEMDSRWYRRYLLCAIAAACRWRASRTGPATANGAMSTTSLAPPAGGLMTVFSPGVVSQLLGAASLKPAAVPMLCPVTACQLYPGGSSPPFGAGLVWLGVGDGLGEVVGVGWLEGLGLPDGVGLFDGPGGVRPLVAR